MEGLGVKVRPVRGVAAIAIVLVTAMNGVAAPQTTLEFWTISLQPFFTDYVNGLVAGYRRANPGVQVKWVDVQFQAVEQKRSEERRVGKECRSRWSPYH